MARHYGWNCVPVQEVLLTPNSHTVSLFANRVLAGMIRSVMMRSSWSRVGS